MDEEVKYKWVYDPAAVSISEEAILRSNGTFTVVPDGNPLFTVSPAEINILRSIMTERAYQNGKHGRIEDAPHTPAGWMLLIESELQEAKHAIIKGGTGRDGWRAELVQVIALCFATLEQHGLTDKEGREI